MYTTPTEFRTLRDRFREGTFDPLSINWAVGENRVPISDASAPEGWKYENRVCIYMMGDGSQQVVGEFPLTGVPSPDRWEMAREIIRINFPTVTRIINGVG